MKRAFLWTLIALVFCALPGKAEGELIAAPTPSGLELQEFSGEGVELVLPEGFQLLEGEALAGYDAAVQAEYPNVARTLFAAVDENHGAALILAAAESDLDCLVAARQAAEELLGNSEAAEEKQFGGNRCGTFACAIGDQAYHLYYFSDGKRILTFGASGLEVGEIEELLKTLEF